jgi:UDP-glucose 4-epimerase
MLCESYACSFQTPIVVLRPFNTYGPRQSARAVIPTILSQLISGRTEIHLGNTTPRRDLTFVSDTVAGFLAAGRASGIEGRTVHLGTGRSESIEELFHAACHACGVEAKLVSCADRFRPDRSEVQVLQSDPSRAWDLLGWQATVGLEQGLALTADWMRANIDRYTPDRYVI